MKTNTLTQILLTGVAVYLIHTTLCSYGIIPDVISVPEHKEMKGLLSGQTSDIRITGISSGVSLPVKFTTASSTLNIKITGNSLYNSFPIKIESSGNNIPVKLNDVTTSRVNELPVRVKDGFIGVILPEDAPLKIYTANNRLIIDSPYTPEPVSVYNLKSQCIYESELVQGRNEIILPSGNTYIIVIKSQVYKITL